MSDIFRIRIGQVLGRIGKYGRGNIDLRKGARKQFLGAAKTLAIAYARSQPMDIVT